MTTPISAATTFWQPLIKGIEAKATTGGPVYEQVVP